MSWKDIQARIQEEISKEEELVQETQALKTVEEDAQVPEQFKEAAPDLFSDDQKAQIKAERQAEEDAYLKKLNIISVYKKLTGNNVKLSGGENEKLVFCPTAGHHNVNSEAACINTSKGTWVCYGQCEDGGGIIDMVAAANGMPFGKKLKGTDYAKAKQKTLEDFCGWEFERQGKGWVGKSPETQKREQEEFEAEYGSAQPVDNPVDNPSASEVANRLGFSLGAIADDDDLPELGATSFNKGEFGADSPQDKVKASPHQDPPPASLERKPPSPKLTVLTTEEKIVAYNVAEEDIPFVDKLPEMDDPLKVLPPGTPLYEFMYATQYEPYPREYFFWRGLQLLALSAGPYVRGSVANRLFRPSLMALFVGISGAGKSQTWNFLDDILEHPAYRWMTGGPTGKNPLGNQFMYHTGLAPIREMGSGEALVKSLSTYKDPTSQQTYNIADVTALLEYDEISTLMSKSAISGSSLMQRIMAVENSSKLSHGFGSTTSKEGEMFAYNPSLCVCTGVQPGMLSEVLGRNMVANGFVARFDVVTGNYKFNPNTFDATYSNIDHARELYGEVARKYLLTDKDERKLVVIPFEDECREVFQPIDNRMQKLQMSGISTMSKFQLKFRKYCLLMAINAGHESITVEDVQAAGWIMEYIERSTQFASGKLVASEGNEMDQAVLDIGTKLTEKDGRFTLGVLKNRVKPPRRGWDTKKYDERVQYLIESGELIEVRSGSKSDSRTRASYAVPTALKNYNRSVKPVPPSREAK